MNQTFTGILYIISFGLLCISFTKDRAKTIGALKRAWKMFLNILPQFIAILFITGLLLTLMDPEMIKKTIGAQSGFLGLIVSSLAGAVALVPVIVAFPIASELLNNGAGIGQIAVFISTLTTVGFITLPLETKYLGRKLAVWRNILAFILSYGVAIIAEMVML